MSVSAAQFNRPGLGGTFGVNQTRSGVKAAVAKKLSNATGPTVDFSLTASHGKNYVSGRNTRKGNHVTNYTRMRQAVAGTNRTYTPRSAGIDYSYAMPSNQNYDAGTMSPMGLMMGLQMLNSMGGLSGIGGAVAGLFGGKEAPATAGQALESGVSSLGSGGSTLSSVSGGGVASSITGMQSANDSATLRQAITGAEGQLNDLSYVNNKKAQTDFEKAKADVKTLEGEVKTATTERDEAKQEVANAEQGVRSQTTVRDSKKQALINAMTRKNQCSTAYAQAHAINVATPAQIPGPDGTLITNPAKAKAEEAERNAKTELDKANEAAVKADKEVQQAEGELEKAQNNLDKAESNKSEKEQILNDKQEALDKKQAELDNKKAEVEKFKQDKQDYETLKKEVDKQKERLTKLEKKEQETFNELSSDIAEKDADVADRATRIDASNGMNIAEKVRQRRNERAEAKMEEMNEQKAKLADNNYKTQLLQSSDFETGQNGEELRTGNLPSGGQVYYIGTREVTQAEYEAAKVQNS